jgi:DNA mismatch repair protein MutS2
LRTEVANADSKKMRLISPIDNIAEMARQANAAAAAAEIAGGSEEISEGDRVRIHSLDQVGMVESIREGIYIIIIGFLRYRAERSDIKKVENSYAPAVAFVPAPSVADTTDDVVSELKVIGMTADEALDRVDKFLDQAFFAGIESVRIIHGHGKGILRNAIAKFLTDHPQVERFNLAPPDKGGGGTTLVELKKYLPIPALMLMSTAPHCLSSPAYDKLIEN